MMMTLITTVVLFVGTDAARHRFHSLPNAFKTKTVSTEVCRTRFLLATCRPSAHCLTGKMCMDTTYRPCCQPPSSDCPTSAQLGFQCSVNSPTNWCRHNEDCRGRKCCPTGCNYNVCV